jgi:hypothetical protein
VAAGLARRGRRAVLLQARFVLPFQVVVASVWLAWMLSPQRRVPVGFLWFWAAAWVALVGVAPFYCGGGSASPAMPSKLTTGLLTRHPASPHDLAAEPLHGLPTRQMVAAAASFLSPPTRPAR